ncbi:hypothetical protein L1887_02670 [Cichorium endivia]|nr:hypothetical protein L1887_02670 [Cichorium endivia]
MTKRRKGNWVCSDAVVLFDKMPKTDVNTTRKMVIGNNEERKVPGKCLRSLAWDGDLLKDEGTLVGY